MNATPPEPVSPNTRRILGRSTLLLSSPRRAPCTASTPLSLGCTTSPSVITRPRPHAPPMNNSRRNNPNSSKLPQSTPRSRSTLAPPTCLQPTAAPSLAMSSPPPTRRLTRLSIQTRPAKFPALPASRTHLHRCRSSPITGGLRSNACRLTCDWLLKDPPRVWHDPRHTDLYQTLFWIGFRRD